MLVAGTALSRDNNFDLIRLLAAAQVVLSHSRDHLKVTIPSEIYYWPGVPVFFIVSGFLITASLARCESVTEYFTKRALRIFPALWVMTAVTLFILVLMGRVPELWRVAGYIVAQASFFQHVTFGALSGFGTGGNGALWTIVVELHFYLLLPLLFFLLARFRIKRRTLVIASILLASALFYSWLIPVWVARHDLPKMLQRLIYYGGYISAAPHAFMFLIGVLAYMHFERLKPFVQGRFLYWLAGYLAFMLTIDKVYGLSGWALHSFFPVMLAQRLLLAGVVLSLAFSWAGLSRRLLRGNDISYGVYIYHMVVINVLLELGMNGSWSDFGVAVVLTAAAATASWILIEKPVLTLKRRAPRDVVPAQAPA